jgi:16S rRNA A1518/A1519 N6-dimethyltransferase RsmA/KsgA/DIM1 with predicted DNA glycosylase/AP lyase activity
MTDDGWFGEDVAATYDQDAPMFDPAVLEPAVAFLAALAGDGPVLEFAIGTGRIALPLAARGPRVAGIELSRAMVARLRAKLGGDAASIPVAIGDMASTRVEGAGSFTLVYLATFFVGSSCGSWLR